MKPASFEYVRATSLDQVLALLDKYGDTAKILAGGQSLLPMMNFRLVQPAVVVDISAVPDMPTIAETAGGLSVGAMVRHAELMRSDLVARQFPIVSHAMKFVAHTAIRNRGTIGGSLSHADPAAELPMIAILLDATFQIVSAQGRRSIAAKDFFLAPLTTDLAENELLLEVELPLLPNGTTWAFEEVSRRSGDFALAAVGTTFHISDGRFADVRIAATGIGEAPMRFAQAENLLEARLKTDLHDQLLEEVANEIMAAITPSTDLQASSDYRRHLIGVLTKRAIMTASQRASEGA